MFPLTAVTFTPDEKEMQVLHSTLGGISEICCLPGLDSAKRAEVLAGADVILARSLARAEIEPGEAAGLESAGLVQLIFAGVNNVPFDRLPAGVRVAGNAGAFAGPLAEHVLGMVLCLAKAMIPGHIGLAQGRFESSVFSRELRGGTCGIIGMGGNGAAIARSDEEDRHAGCGHQPQRHNDHRLSISWGPWLTWTRCWKRRMLWC